MAQIKTEHELTTPFFSVPTDRGTAESTLAHTYCTCYTGAGGGGLLRSKESQLRGEERKMRRKNEKRKREGTFTIHLYSLFCEQFVVQNLNNLILTLKIIHNLFAYSLCIFELLENAL
jgi:hypothetical protein